MQVTHVKTVPAPVGGWNARDPLAAMGAQDAVTLDNWFPRVADCTIRGGTTNHVTGFASRPASLMTYLPPSGSNKMFASTNAGVFDVTSAGALGAAVAACTNGYWNWTQMGVSGGTYLMMFNGTDKPLYYDGTTWTAVDGVSAPAITGLTTTSIVAGNIFKRRLYMLQNNKLSFWYLAVDAVGGVANEFLLGPLCSHGGYAMAIDTWSFDGGTGPDDYLAIATSEGELLIFKGSNPADPTAFSAVGTYYVGRPLGRKCFRKFGGDLILMTQLGAIPLSKILLSTTVDYHSALTDKILNAFNGSALSYYGNTGWEIQLHSTKSALIFNIPTAAGATTAVQYVMNTITGKWCSFSGWNASAFAVFNGELYFADSTKISKAWTGKSDNATNINANAETAYSNFGSSTQLKNWKLFRPMFLVDGLLSFSVGLSVDFSQTVTLSPATFSAISGARWDVDLWDVGMWAAGLEIIASWRSPAAKPGYWAAGIVQIGTNSLEVQWVANDYTFEVGGVVG